jgi:hypothetical protein
MRKLIFGVESDLYVAGRTEDGENYTAEMFFVVAEDDNGNRWRHPETFAGCRAMFDEENDWPYFVDVRAAAQASAQRLLATERAAASVDLTQWYELPPVYGSPAYQAYGQFNDWAEEQTERGHP